ncbi:MAG: PPOX class F420-dependent oxidoreductase [Candidatus Thermofonsia Clade 3 bacterium]|uniref:PPOX class F420-dependent oxidoreductase n=1 Tax=Candidatus Thermofonsia Clade 3 bacterium TaxID=2364212 RepID=A0A2M8QF35_9CHLR|nr:MAG: PPOX class F420-dependent oxidoreductase [Candidatus Thermofonsia Clade 3 bacterium]
MTQADPLQSFEGQRFLALETFRKNGVAVRTPVGFVRDGDVLLIRTEADSGKVKRIRNNDRVRIAPSTGRGDPLGDWVEARAQILDDPAASEAARQKIAAKYGLIWRLIEGQVAIRNRLSRRKRPGWVSIRLTPIALRQE